MLRKSLQFFFLSFTFLQSRLDEIFGTNMRVIRWFDWRISEGIFQLFSAEIFSEGTDFDDWSTLINGLSKKTHAHLRHSGHDIQITFMRSWLVYRQGTNLSGKSVCLRKVNRNNFAKENVAFSGVLTSCPDWLSTTRSITDKQKHINISKRSVTMKIMSVCLANQLVYVFRVYY